MNRYFQVTAWLITWAAIFGCQLLQFSLQEVTLPLEWAVTPLTKQQVSAVKECDLENLVKERYPDTIKTDELSSAYTPDSDCDWAILALAYAERADNNETPSESAKAAYSQAVSNNFGFALATPIFHRYFGSVSLVEAPPFATQEITDVQIKYEWSGLGDSVNYSAEIHQANSTPTIAVTPNDLSASINTDIDKKLIQALAPALTDLLPVESSFTLTPCFDNYPNWVVHLTFKDHTTVELTTASNFLYFGGPWLTEIDAQNYVQVSIAFAKALSELVVNLELPIGQTAGMTCFGDAVFEKAFP